MYSFHIMSFIPGFENTALATGVEQVLTGCQRLVVKLPPLLTVSKSNHKTFSLIELF